jgi:hypothetical protein
MRKHMCASRKECSGQLLIVVALAIAILISSTSIYVYELSREPNSQSLPVANYILIIKQCTKNALISALANISNGGQKTVLATNLDELSGIVRSLRQPAIFQLTFDLLNNSDYESGVLLSWGGEGSGFSSVYANFTLNVQGAENAELEYTLNITTTVLVEGHYIVNGDEKNVTLTCTVYNEGEPALVRNISLFYELGGVWGLVTSLDNLSTVDFGNGTYVLSFATISSSETIQVSTHIYDLRDIFAYANATCTKVY